MAEPYPAMYRLHVLFDGGTLGAEEPATRRVDCPLWADPVVFLNWYSQWRAIATAS